MHLTSLAVLLFALLPGLACAAAAVPAPEPVVTQVMSQPLPDYPGKEALILTVQYPGGGADRCIAMTPMALSMCWRATW